MDFGNFVIYFHPKSMQIGNFVSKISDFDPFLALAKNLTISGRPNEMKGTKKTDNLDCFVPRNDAKRQKKVLRSALRPLRQAQGPRLRDLNQQRLNN